MPRIYLANFIFYVMLIYMKTVVNINPELEYENAKQLIELAKSQALDTDSSSSLSSSVENLMTATRVLMEREERRRGLYKSEPPNANSPKGRSKGESREESKKLPSERYSNLEVKEVINKPAIIPLCSCCQAPMVESGLYSTKEKLEIQPAVYFITRLKSVKYNCSKCHGSMVNTAAPASIVPTSNYGDSLIIDVALSKYCDLIPIERYAQIAYRQGLEDLPAQSLIGLTHHLANFLLEVYIKLKLEVQKSKIIQADETPHKMLEGDEKMNWFLWGFFCKTACCFEIHDTRSGDVATSFLKDSLAEFLLTDGYAGYGKSIKELKEKYNNEVGEVFCNAHAYRYFEEASTTWKDECAPFLELYGKIYELEEQKNKSPSTEAITFRQMMLPHFESIKTECEKQQQSAMPHSGLSKAINYFLNHFSGLTKCLINPDIPLDNNLSERELRAPVIGRKTWYGNHSKRGALTSAILFSIVQSCKLNNINPRKYFPWVVELIHQGKAPLTPSEYLNIIKST